MICGHHKTGLKKGTKLKVATGEYNKMIDKRIAEIKALYV